jgi:DNA-binding XRE family transcriptional regulator
LAFMLTHYTTSHYNLKFKILLSVIYLSTSFLSRDVLVPKASELAKRKRLLKVYARRLGLEVRSKRLARRLTQGELAEHIKALGLEVTQGYISLIESGKREDPNIKTVVALALVLEISLDDLLHDLEGDEDAPI